MVLLQVVAAAAIGVLVTNGVKRVIARQGRSQTRPRASSKDVTAPYLLVRVEPRYPDEALRVRVNATVRVSGEVSTAGVAENIKVVQPAGFGLDEAAVAACRHWRFAPATKNGRPIRMRFGTSVTFRIPEQGIPTAALQFDLPSTVARPLLERGSLAGLTLPHAQIIEADFDVTAQGIVRRIRCLDVALQQRLSHWQFRPARLNGIPVQTHAKLTIFATS